MDERRRVIGEGAQAAQTIEPRHWVALDLVIVVSAARSPVTGGLIDAEWAGSARAEVAQLRAASVDVLLISADDDASESMGDDLLPCGDLRRSVRLGRQAATTAVDTK